MVHRLELDYGRQWGLSFALGCGTWFLGVSFAKFLPPSVQLLFFGLPIACFGYCIHVLPHWQRQGRARDLDERLAEEEAANIKMQQHHLTIAAQNVDFELAMQGLNELYPTSAPPDSTDGASSLAAPQSEAANLQQTITQATGDLGWEFFQYCTTKADNLTDADGFIKLARVQSAWGKNRGFKTADLRELVQAFVNLGFSEWSDGNRRQFRPFGNYLNN